MALSPHDDQGMPDLARWLCEEGALGSKDALQVAGQLQGMHMRQQQELWCRRQPCSDCTWLERAACNLRRLRELYGQQGPYEAALLQSPQLLLADLESWLEFLDGFGVPSDTMAKVCLDAPDLLVQGSVYNAGNVILFFKSQGFKNEDIVRRVIRYYPFLLSRDLDHDIQPVVDYLQQAGCFGENLRLLIWEFPRIFSRDYRRQVRKFQYLSVYGLSPAKALSPHERLMMRVM